MGSFVHGPNVASFVRLSEQPVRLLESVTSAELALSVPYVRITQLDPATKAPLEGVRPLSFELVEPPRFGAPAGGRRERPVVSLEQVTTRTNQSYGTIFFVDYEIDFVVHRPEEVFSDGAGTTWRALLQEGTSHMIEYGWTSHAGSRNDLFNGVGYHDPGTGLVVPSIKTELLVTNRYTFSIGNDGEMRFKLHALSGGELAFRNVRLGDAVGIALDRDTDLGREERDEELERRLTAALEHIPPRKSDYVSFLDVMDTLVVPAVEGGCRQMGYGNVEFLMGNFNARAGQTTEALGSVMLSGRSIGEFLIPLKTLKKDIGNLKRGGSALTLFNFLNSVMNQLNGGDRWRARAGALEPPRFPNVQVATSTFKMPDGRLGLRVLVIDANEGIEAFHPDDVLLPDEQTRERVLDIARERGVPVVSFGAANAFVSETSFDVTLDELMRSVFIDESLKERKTRAQVTKQSEHSSRRGAPAPEELLPLSVLQGEMTMLGNFVFEMFGPVWLDFFGAPQMSGLFKVREKSDVISPGTFKSTVSVVSEGLDPLNTRKRLSAEGLRAEADRKRGLVEAAKKK